MSIERRIEKLEASAPRKPKKLIILLSKLRGFKLQYDLGPNPSEEEVEEAISRMSSHYREIEVNHNEY